MSLSSPVAVVAADDGVVSAPSIPDGPTPTRQTRPKILDRDPAAWINQPPTDEIQLAA